MASIPFGKLMKKGAPPPLSAPPPDIGAGVPSAGVTPPPPAMGPLMAKKAKPAKRKGGRKGY